MVTNIILNNKLCQASFIDVKLKEENEVIFHNSKLWKKVAELDIEDLDTVFYDGNIISVESVIEDVIGQVIGVNEDFTSIYLYKWIGEDYE